MTSNEQFDGVSRKADDAYSAYASDSYLYTVLIEFCFFHLYLVVSLRIHVSKTCINY